MRLSVGLVGATSYNDRFFRIYPLLGCNLVSGEPTELRLVVGPSGAAPLLAFGAVGPDSEQCRMTVN
jgi:hypothetical protein